MADLLSKLIKSYTYWDRAGDCTRFQTLYPFVLGRYGYGDIEKTTPAVVSAVENGLALQKEMGHTARPEDCAMMNIRSAARCVRNGGKEYRDFIELLKLLGLTSVVDEYFSAAALMAERIGSLSIS